MSIQSEATLGLLKQAMAVKGDFPAVSSELSRIMRTMKEDDNADDKLADVILSDFALTQKVLRLANSAMYSAFGQTVTTVPLAVYVLGTETVGHLAMSLALLDNLGQAADTARAHQELAKTTLSGAVARKIGASVSLKAGESLAVASMLRGLGKLLVCFYLPEKFDAVEARGTTLDDENAVVQELLGLSYDDIATTVATNWKFPTELTELVTEPPEGANADLTWIHAVTGYSRRYVEAVADGGAQAVLTALAARFAESTGIATEDLLANAGAAVAEAQEPEAMPAASKFLENAQKKAAAAPAPTAAPATTVVATPVALIVEPGEPPGAETSSLVRLTNGLAELEQVRLTLKPTQVLGRAAELMWSTLGGSRFLLFLHNRQSGTFDLMTGRGDGVQEQVRKLKFEDGFASNLVNQAIVKASLVYMHEALLPGNAAKLPGWLMGSFPPAKSLLLLPLATGGHATGLMYMDWGTEGRATPLTWAEMAQLERLRAMVSESLHTVRAGK